jgi:hypothetical protein
MDPIYGLLDNIDAKPKPKKRKLLAPRKINKDLKYNAGASTEDLDDSVEYSNSINIPLSLLKDVSDKSQSRARALADVMLRSSIANTIALDSAIDYANGVLVDGFGVDPKNIGNNSEIKTVQNNLSSLEIIYQILKHSKLPKITKRRFLRAATLDLAKGSVEAILRGEKNRAISESVKNGIVTGRKAVEKPTNGVGVKNSRKD